MKILIKNGTILNGLGGAEQKGDILIENEIIKKIETEKPLKEKADKIIDATNYFVCPGFIDINNESDHYLTLFNYPEQESALFQGITTIIIGNNGCSMAPVFKESLETLRKWSSLKININWQAMNDFFSQMKKTRPFVNIASLVGHSTIKRGITDDEFRDLIDEELEQLKNLIDKSLIEGAAGISCGLKYIHNSQVSFAELLILAQLAKRHNKVLFLQLRDQKNDLISSVEEIESLTETLGIENCPKIEITHFYAYKENIDELWQAVFLIQKLKERGLDINFDLLPFTLINNPMYLYFPDWFRYGSLKTMINNLKNKNIVKRIFDDFKQNKYDFSKMIISSNQNNIPFINGKSIAYLAKEREITPEEMFVEIFRMTNGEAVVLSDDLSLPETLGLMESNLSIISTHNPTLNYHNFDFLPHPASFNTFPRFLAFVKENKISISFSQAIRKITFEPALKLKLNKRGLILKNYFADVVIFNPDEITSDFNFSNINQKPKGIKFVIVNGEIIVDNGNLNKIPNGRILEISKK